MSHTIFDRLPDLYRRRGGSFLARFTGVAESLLEDLDLVIDEEEGRAGEVLGLLRPREGERAAAGAASGTRGELRRWLAARGCDAWVWPGLAAAAEGAGRVRFARSWRRAVVVAWRERAPEDAVIAELARWTPAGCETRGVVLREEPVRRPPLPGSAVAGEIVL